MFPPSLPPPPSPQSSCLKAEWINCLVLQFLVYGYKCLVVCVCWRFLSGQGKRNGIGKGNSAMAIPCVDDRSMKSVFSSFFSLALFRVCFLLRRSWWADQSVSLSVCRSVRSAVLAGRHTFDRRRRRRRHVVVYGGVAVICPFGFCPFLGLRSALREVRASDCLPRRYGTFTDGWI
ncbi:hypothetical protein IWX90DRAFT_437923 [Phyllosticta citrichinensis]|uniref:Transmembrane protein n=1 Tax=Phyllosticta citrichinensis TaxID=1130410 RepID=A0ABR1XMV5_9PEZI